MLSQIIKPCIYKVNYGNLQTLKKNSHFIVPCVKDQHELIDYKWLRGQARAQHARSSQNFIPTLSSGKSTKMSKFIIFLHKFLNFSHFMIFSIFEEKRGCMRKRQNLQGRNQIDRLPPQTKTRHCPQCLKGKGSPT